jgi:hypothetical protein
MKRLVFGCSQYYSFINPTKAAPTDVHFTFEMTQDEIGQASGQLIKDTKNMTQGDLFFNFNKLRNDLITIFITNHRGDFVHERTNGLNAFD